MVLLSVKSLQARDRDAAGWLYDDDKVDDKVDASIENILMRLSLPSP